MSADMKGKYVSKAWQGFGIGKDWYTAKRVNLM